MISNLNQLNIKDYGTIFPERQSEPVPVHENQRTLTLSQQDIPLYRTAGGTWLRNGSGMTVLSVSMDGEIFQHYYLDKPVCLHGGIWFSLYPFLQGSSTVHLSADILPELLGQYRKDRDFQPSPRLRVKELYTFFYQEKERGFFFPGEAHPMLELTYVDQGQLHSVADGQDLLLKQGEMVIYAPNQWHMQYADIDIAPRYVTISFSLEGGDLSGLLNRKFSPPQSTITLLQQMLKEQAQMDEYSTDIIISLLSQLLLAILRQTGTPAAKLKTSNSLHSENQIIRRAQQYISTHIREKLSVPLVAQKVDVSPSYLTALFHRNLQISPGEYIRRIKLQESKQMIRENAMSFTEIAAALQYSTVHHFSRQFKDKFGITPTEYAKSVR